MEKEMLENFKEKEINYTNSYLMAIVSREYDKAMRMKVLVQESQIAKEKLEILDELKLEDLKIDLQGMDE